MISISKKLSKFYWCAVICVSFLPSFASAQTSLSLSVSPTLFDMTANPGQEWESFIRVINSNPYEITVYGEVVNFAPQGEGGQGRFIPVIESESSGQTLAEWIKLEDQEITIPPEQTIEIPFKINVTEGAPPGGHFAAVLIGTKAPASDTKMPQLQTSQVVTSLIFLRVTGDVIEQGNIREFRSISRLAEKPEMGFELRFENKGNVHLLPQGEIKIFNMWGQERGVIPVNRQTLFGSVLPNQIRKYTYSWTGEWSIADMGRYSAIATLGYGVDSRKFSTSETYFWVIPWKIASVLILIILAFISITTWAIKIYIRKMLAMAGVSGEFSNNQNVPSTYSNRRISVVAPIEEGILDLKNRFKSSNSWQNKFTSIINFVSQYRLFFIMTSLVLVFILLLFLYVRAAFIDERAYEITIDSEGKDVTISSEEIEYTKLRSDRDVEMSETARIANFPKIRLVNRSGTNGLAAELRLDLEDRGYEIIELTRDFDSNENNTVIVYNPKFTEQAFQLSKDIEGSLLSSFADAGEDEPITVYVGQNYKNGIQ